MWRKLLVSFSLLFFSLVPGFSQEQRSPNPDMLYLTLELRQLLTDCLSLSINIEQRTEKSEKNVNDVMTKDEENSQRSSENYQEQEATADLLQTNSGEVSQSLTDCMNTSKRTEIERDTWRGIAIGEAVTIAVLAVLLCLK